ncbi:MAG: exosortase-associated EpsI family protein [Chthoniobacteraceae bacterium]
MTTNRLVVLVAFVTFGFATVFLLPKSHDLPTGIRMDLPDFVGNWKGTEGEITDKERIGLGESTGTRILRKTYRNLDGYEITVSIVLSGRDMSTSIHRFERCLDAQGYTPQENDEIAMSLPHRGTFPVTQLRSTGLVKSGDSTVTSELQSFYWFVGEKDICAGHWSRWAIDNRDRLFRGVSQRWAYILVGGRVPVPQDPKNIGAARKWSRDTMREFIKMLAPKIHLDSVHYN